MICWFIQGDFSGSQIQAYGSIQLAHIGVGGWSHTRIQNLMAYRAQINVVFLIKNSAMYKREVGANLGLYQFTEVA